MSIIVNGTTIPENDGNIIASSVSVQKVIVNDSIVWEVPQEITVSWEYRLSQYGNFINKTSPPSTMAYAYKQIRYTKPDGTVAVANPYTGGTSIQWPIKQSITIKKGTKIYFDMYSSNTSGTWRRSEVGIYVNGSLVNSQTADDGSLISCEYTPVGDCMLAKKEDKQDNQFGDTSNKAYAYYWAINITY